MSEVIPEESSKANSPQKRQLIPKRWWRRRKIRVWSEEELARLRGPKPELSIKMKQLHQARTEAEKQTTRYQMSASAQKYWSKASRVHRRRPRKNVDTSKMAEAAKIQWDTMSEEEYEARTAKISEGMKQKWAQRTQAQKDAIARKRSRTRMMNKLGQAVEQDSVQDQKETPPEESPSSAELSLINSRSSLGVKMDQFKFYLQTLEDPDPAYATFWASLTPLQQKRVMRMALNAYKKGFYATYKTL